MALGWSVVAGAWVGTMLSSHSTRDSLRTPKKVFLVGPVLTIPLKTRTKYKQIWDKNFSSPIQVKKV